VTLSLASWFARGALPVTEGQVMGIINYGFNKLRFLNPVVASDRVRGRFVMDAVEKKGNNRLLRTTRLTVEIDGKDIPVLAKTSKKIADIRNNWQHHVSKEISSKAYSVLVEKIDVKSMTKSARKLVKKNSDSSLKNKNVKNRSVLETGWYTIEGMLKYKSGSLVNVKTAASADPDKRKTGVNAAKEILTLGKKILKK